MDKKELIELEHNLKMEELKRQEGLIRLEHSLKLEEMRIKTAEIRRSQERQENKIFMEKNRRY